MNLKVTIALILATIFGPMASFVVGYKSGITDTWNKVEEQCVFRQSFKSKDGLVFACAFIGVNRNRIYLPPPSKGLDKVKD